MPNPSFYDSNGTIWPNSWEDMGVRTFPNGICPKMNIIARLEFELAYSESAAQRFNHYTNRSFTGGNAKQIKTEI